MSTDPAADDTISIDGIGSIPSPSALAEANRSKYDTDDVAVPDACPVPGCSATGFNTFTELRGHFGHVADGAHRAYDLSIDDYRPDSTADD